MSTLPPVNLSVIRIFSRFTNEDLTAISAIGEIIQVKPHAHVIIEGEPTRGLYVIISGRVSIYRNEPGSTTMSRLAMLEEGANFGELSLIDSAPRSATVIAETACDLFSLDAARFHGWLDNSPADVSVRFYRSCAEELAVRMRRVNQDYITAQQQLWRHALRRVEAKAT
jgi:CRP-like cAMP-binding protein